MAKALSTFVLLASVSCAAAAADDWEKTRSIAESQHEIVMLLIKNKQYDKVLVASKKIFALSFPADREHLKVEHARLASAALAEQRNFSLAHQILDEALKAVTTNKSKALLYKEKAVLYRQDGQDAQAMKCLEEAVRLEEAKP
jgi:tetratricopeptide (TPR) repeat protein